MIDGPPDQRDCPPSGVRNIFLLIRNDLPHAVLEVTQSYLGPSSEPLHCASFLTIINAVCPAVAHSGGDLELFLGSPAFTEAMRDIADAFWPYVIMVDELEEQRRENSHLWLRNNLHAEEICELEEDLACLRDRSTRWRGAYHEASAAAAVASLASLAVTATHEPGMEYQAKFGTKSC